MCDKFSTCKCLFCAGTETLKNNQKSCKENYHNREQVFACIEGIHVQAAALFLISTMLAHTLRIYQKRATAREKILQNRKRGVVNEKQKRNSHSRYFIRKYWLGSSDATGSSSKAGRRQTTREPDVRKAVRTKRIARQPRARNRPHGEPARRNPYVRRGYQER